jgi:hypothetical protein
MSVSQKRHWAVAARLVLAIFAAFATRNFIFASNALREAPAANIDFPSGNPLTDPLAFSPAERLLFDDTTDGRFHRLSLLEAGLIASGATDLTAIAQAEQTFAATVAEIRRLNAEEIGELGAEGNPSQTLRRVELMHGVLHSRLLRGGYDVNATNLARTLKTGVYNCASATLLFVALAKEMNLEVHAVELPGHVRATLDDDGQSYAVEVTCPVWSEAIRPQSFRNGNSSEQASRAIASSMPERAVSAAGLVAMIYYNRGIDAFNAGRFSDAITANRKALLLDDENKSARGNLLAAVNNWALALGDAGNFTAAESLLVFGQQYDPQHLPFSQNRAHIEQMWERTQAAISAKE